MGEKIKVVYIVGWGRSGSTILSSILGQMEGFQQIGEINYIWKDGFRQDGICGCGKPFSQCVFWTRIFEDFSRIAGPVQAERWERIGKREIRSITAIRHFLFPHSSVLSPEVREYLIATGKLYESIHRVTGHSVLVDISHSPFYGRLLQTIPQLDVFFVHLIRDPRATAFSWSTPKYQPGRYPMQRIGTAKNALLWHLWNSTAEDMRRREPERFLQLRYEDFIRRPRSTVDEILRFLRETPSVLPFLSDTSVRINSDHILRGNPVRFQTGTVDLVEDIRWKTQMKQFDRWVTEFLTWPLVLRYGYVASGSR